jgi:hypothetical protein
MRIGRSPTRTTRLKHNIIIFHKPRYGLNSGPTRIVSVFNTY